MLTFHTTGNVGWVEFGEVNIWNDEDDPRPVVDEPNDVRVPLEEFFRQQIDKVLATMSRLPLLSVSAMLRKS